MELKSIESIFSKRFFKNIKHVQSGGAEDKPRMYKGKPQFCQYFDRPHTPCTLVPSRSHPHTELEKDDPNCEMGNKKKCVLSRQGHAQRSPKPTTSKTSRPPKKERQEKIQAEKVKKISVEHIEYLEKKNIKGDNKFVNDIREKVIEYLLNMKEDDTFLTTAGPYQALWKDFYEKIQPHKTYILILAGLPGGSIHAKNVGETKNFDFDITVIPGERDLDEQGQPITTSRKIKLEYKHQGGFKEIPQFYQKDTIGLPIFNPSYEEYFFKEAIPKIIDMFPASEEHPNYFTDELKTLQKQVLSDTDSDLYRDELEEYRRIVKQKPCDIGKKSGEDGYNEAYVARIRAKGRTANRYASELVAILRTISHTSEEDKQRLDTFVDEFTEQYWKTIQSTLTEEMVQTIQAQLIQTQTGKNYMFYNREDKNWIIKTLPDPLNLTTDLSKISIRKSPRGKNWYLIIPTELGNTVHFLLRWKNRKGVILPAWQISFHFKTGEVFTGE